MGNNEDSYSHLFIWIVENCPTLLSPDCIQSPSFVADETRWHLELSDPRQPCLSIITRRELDDGPDDVEVDLELSYLSADGVPLLKENNRVLFSREALFVTHFELPISEMFGSKRDEFLPGDTLTVLCCIQVIGMNLLTASLYFGRTRLSIEDRTFFWCISDFTKLNTRQEVTYIMESTLAGYSSLTLGLHVRDDNGTENVVIRFTDDGEKSSVFNCEISVLDTNGIAVFTRKGPYFITNPNLFAYFVQKSELVEQEAFVLPNDVLTLRCHFQIGIGPQWSGIERCMPLS